MVDERQSSRLLTLVFTDIVDSTALKNERGDIVAGELLERDRGHVERLAEDHGGRVIDWAGDGCFLTFESSSEAVLFGIALQAEHLADAELPPIRLGIHMGDVTERTRADGSARVEGLAVDLTARLESLAHPNQILLSEAVHHSARQRLLHHDSEKSLRWTSHGPYGMKGFDARLEVCSVGADDGSPVAAPVRSEKAWPVATSEARSGNTGPADGDDLRLLRRLWRRPQGVAAVIALVAALSLGVFYVPNAQRNRTEAKMIWAREEAVPAVQKLVEEANYAGAYALALEADEYIDDMLLDLLIGKCSGIVTITTNVPGAHVSYKPYDKPESEWLAAGVTPLESLSLSTGIYRWRVELEGYTTRELARPVYPLEEAQSTAEMVSQFDDLFLTMDLTLVSANTKNEGMAFIESGLFFPAFTGLQLSTYNVGPFYMDITEVTNEAYRDFVDSGGYSDSKYWSEAFVLDGEEQSFEQAMKRFVDSTGRAGPSSWVMGDVPPGQEDYPVQGVSWYEAMAYAKFRGKMLPTVYHWARVALPPAELANLPLGPRMIAYSNLQSDGPVPVASAPDLSAEGAYNMAGNVREWCSNERGGKRVAMGGKWDDPEYALHNVAQFGAWERDEGNGFRCMRLAEGEVVAAEYLEALNESQFVFNRERYTPQALRAMTALFAAQPQSDYAVQVDSVVDTHRNHVREELSIEVPGIAESRLPLIIQKPKTGEGPWPAVLFIPGIDALFLDDPDSGMAGWVQFIPQSERLLVRPVLSGMYYRGAGSAGLEFLDPSSRTTLIRDWILELNHTVAYLKTRSDVDSEAISFLGISLGPLLGIIAAASNEDIQTLVLVLAGLPPLQEADGLSPVPLFEEFATLVRQPVFMLNGRHDFMFPYEDSQKPLFELLAVDPAHKRHKIFEDQGHSLPAQSELIQEILPWLDRYERGIPESDGQD